MKRILLLDKLTQGIGGLCRRLLARIDIHGWLALGAIAALSALMMIHFVPDRVTLQVGDRSPVTLRAGRSVTYEDTEATQRFRSSAAATVRPHYVPNKAALGQAAQTLNRVFASARHARGDSALPTAESKIDRIVNEVDLDMPRSAAATLLDINAPRFERVHLIARELIDRRLSNDIREGTDDLNLALQAYQKEVAGRASSPVELALLNSLGKLTLRPNLMIDRQRTVALRDAARKAVQPVMGEIRLGDVLVRQNEVVTEVHLDKFRALGLINPRIELLTGLALVGLASAMVLLVSIAIKRARPAIYKNPRQLFLLALISVASVFGLRLFGALLGIPLTGFQFGYLGMMSVVAAGMLIAVLVDVSIGVLITSVLAVVSGLLMNHEIRFSVMTLVGGLAGIQSVANIRDRGSLLKATFLVSAVNVAMVWILGGILNDTLEEVAKGSLWAIISALVGVGAFWFGVALLERPFGVLTHVGLLELSSSEQPLLRELALSAPGTYAHSIAVGNLAEAAAKAIQADALFCRVASYYHDIGKMRRPHCFVENQQGGNIHDKLNPSLSALIIASHVREGVEIAEQRRLPRQIIEIIRQHHGTSLIRYFFHQAAQAAGQAVHDPVLEQHFRYEGPKPQTRESGIIMLADSVEAAARTLDKGSLPRVQSLVEAIIHEKLTDGQLDECNLTLRDIGRVRDSFVRSLAGMVHARIEYPEPLTQQTSAVNSPHDYHAHSASTSGD